MRFTAQEKIRILKKVLREKRSVAEVCRYSGISRKTFYQWKKTYSLAPSRAKAKALRPKYSSGKNHPRAKRENFKTQILSIVTLRPNWGSRRISKELQKGKISLSSHAVYEVLKDLDLKTAEQRKKFSSLHQTLTKIQKVYQKKPLRFLPGERKRMVEAVLINKEKTSDVCQGLHISRKTFYKWRRRYLEAFEQGKSLLEMMEDRYVEGGLHPRRTPVEIEKKILNLVVKYPEYSTHRIAQVMPEISNHGVQNVFQRQRLNTYQLRLVYSKGAENLGPATDEGRKRNPPA